jgi:hypothetical protein
MKVSFTSSIKGTSPQWEQTLTRTCLAISQRYNGLGDITW